MVCYNIFRNKMGMAYGMGYHMFEEFDQELDTYDVEEKLEQCDSVEELKTEILPLLKSQKQQWEKEINHLLKNELHCTQSEFERISGFSRQSINKWCNGSLPKSRENFIRIGLAAGYDIEKVNVFLQKYGRYPALYSKTLEDCICMYVLLHYPKEQALKKYDELLFRAKHMVMRQIAYKAVKDTLILEKELSEVETDEEFMDFLTTNSKSFTEAYRKLHVYMDEIIKQKSMLKSSSVHNMAKGQEWSSSLKQCVSDIRTGKWYPTRDKIISLGLHFCMTKEEINEMLMLAGMRPLYVKNLFENIIVYILTSAELNDIYVSDGEYYDIDNLCNYAKQVLDEIDIAELDYFLKELPSEADEWTTDR